MKTNLALLTLSLILMPMAAAEEAPFYLGKWQSNEEKTLASMEDDKSIPADTRKAMSHNFFGKLVNEFREDSFTTYFAGQKPNPPNFIDAEIDVISDNTVRIRYYHNRLKEQIEREITIKDGCYTVPVREWNFKEYFCRVE